MPLYDVFVKIKGAKTGDFPGNTTNTKHAGQIDVIEYTHELSSPVDVRTGSASGKVQFKPVTIRKPIDPATPLLFKALSENENLNTVDFEFWTSGATGGLQKYLDVKLTNARVISSKMELTAEDGVGDAAGGAKHTGRGTMGMVTQIIQFAYETMVWTHQGFDAKGAGVGGPKTAEVKWGDM